MPIKRNAQSVVNYITAKRSGLPWGGVSAMIPLVMVSRSAVSSFRNAF